MGWVAEGIVSVAAHTNGEAMKTLSQGGFGHTYLSEGI